MASPRLAPLVRLLVAVALVASGAALVASCDPCAGTPACVGPRRVRYQGRMIEHGSARPVGGVAVDFVRTGGAATERDSIRTTTDADGYFVLDVAVTGAGASVTGDVVVSPPSRPSYRVAAQELRVTTVRGDGGDLGRWVVDPYVAFVGELTYRRDNRQRVALGRVTFRRTGGARIEPESVTAVSDEQGRFFLAPRALEPGDVEGELTIRSPGLPRVSRRTIRLRTLHREEAPSVGGAFFVGPALLYVGEVARRGTGQAVAGAEVTVRRTAGVPIEPASFVVQTGADGRFPFLATPLDDGDVVVDVSVRLPGAATPLVYRDVRVATFDDDAPRFLRVFGFGSSLLWVGEIFERGTGRRIEGATIEWRRTGGIPVEPDRFTVRSDAGGRFPLVTNPLADGEVIGELTIQPPGGGAPTRIPDVRMSTFTSDESRLLRVWGIGPALTYQGELFRRGDGERLVGARVEFVRTGGIGVEPDRFTATTGPGGRFPLVVRPLASGEVVFDLVVQPAGNAPPDTLRGLRMATFDSDEARLAGVWGVGGQLFYAGTVYERATGRPLPDVRIEFRRTGGVAIEPDPLVVRSNEAGIFPFIVRTRQDGEVVGDFTLQPPAPFRAETRRGVAVRTFAADELRPFAYWGVGPSLQYFGEIRRLADDRPVVGAEIEFRRTGGLEATPAVVRTTTNADGRFRLAPVPGGYGTVVGDLVVRPAGGAEVVLPGVRLEVFEADGVRQLGTWRVAAP